MQEEIGSLVIGNIRGHQINPARHGFPVIVGQEDAGYPDIGGRLERPMLAKS